MAKLTTSYIMTLLTVCNDVPAELIDGKVYVCGDDTCINVTECSESDIEAIIERWESTAIDTFANVHYKADRGGVPFKVINGKMHLQDNAGDWLNTESWTITQVNEFIQATGFARSGAPYTEYIAI